MEIETMQQDQTAGEITYAASAPHILGKPVHVTAHALERTQARYGVARADVTSWLVDHMRAAKRRLPEAQGSDLTRWYCPDGVRVLTRETQGGWLFIVTVFPRETRARTTGEHEMDSTARRRAMHTYRDGGIVRKRRLVELPTTTTNDDDDDEIGA